MSEDIREHPSAHEETLRRVVCGEFEAAHPSVAALRASCAECRDTLARLAALDEGLLALAREQHADLERAQGEANASDAERVRRSLETALSPRPAPLRASSGRRWIAWTAAAGVLAVAAWFARGLVPKPAVDTDTQEILLGGKIDCFEPVGKEGGPALFRWKDERPTLGWFQVTVYALGRDPAGKLERDTRLLGSGELREPQWTPTLEQQRSLPAEFYWEVQAFGPEGNGARGFASFSP